MGGQRSRVLRAGGARRRPGAQRAPRGRAARRGARARAGDRPEHRARVGGARAAADVERPGRRAPDGGPPRRLARDVRARALAGRARGDRLVPGEAPAAVRRPRERRPARALPRPRGAAVRVSAAKPAALTLRDSRAELEATFLPGAGMLCCSLRHRGEELLAQNRGVQAYVERGKTMGIPLLYPWANRLAGFDYTVAGRRATVPRDGVRVALDDRGLPIHGVIGG